MEAEAEDNRIKRILHQACNNSMTRIKNKEQRKAAYWWNDNIAQRRKECVEIRRKLQRCRKKMQRNEQAASDINNINKELNNSRRVIRIEIYKAKEDCWRELLDDLDRDPWGLSYKLVMNKLKTNPVDICQRMDLKKMNIIFKTLFPTSRDPPKRGNWEKTNRDIPNITTEELEIIL